jgi:hypothetical protein
MSFRKTKINDGKGKRQGYKTKCELIVRMDYFA